MSENKTPEFLTEALKFGINLGLDRMEKLTSLIGDPQKDIKAVHVAGTNGKGSVCTYIASVLAASGKKVGIFTSPFLERFSERMRIVDGREGLDRLFSDETYGEIGQADLDRLSGMVKEASDKMVSEGFEHPTEFELVTAICFLWFAENNIDIAVLETGLGGRLDSTNVISSPLCTVITSIGYDHQDRLGSTIEEIASEKAGIFKSGCPVIAQDPSEMILSGEDALAVRNVLSEKAVVLGAPITFISTGDIDTRYENGKMEFSFENDPNPYTSCLLGEHQVRNAAVAIAAVRTIPGIFQEDIFYGISHARWKGRAEILSTDPLVLLDGGHNVQCAECLADLINGLAPHEPLRAVMGVMRDKDYEGMLKVYMDKETRFADIIAVKVDNPRSLESTELCDTISFMYNNRVDVEAVDDAVYAFRKAYIRSVKDRLPLVVMGSLYLIGQVREEAIRCTTTNSMLQG